MGNLSLLKIVRADFGDRLASEITADSISQYIESCLERERKLKPSTINRRIEVLHRAFTLAVKAKKLTEVPHMPALSEKDNVRQGFTQRRMLDQVLSNLPEYLRDVILFAFLSSWRKGEVLA